MQNYQLAYYLQKHMILPIYTYYKWSEKSFPDILLFNSLDQSSVRETVSNALL